MTAHTEGCHVTINEVSHMHVTYEITNAPELIAVVERNTYWTKVKLGASVLTSILLAIALLVGR